MKRDICAGDILFNKYLNEVVVIEVSLDGISIRDNKGNIYEYGFDAFGKALFLKSDHSKMSFKNQDEYFEFAIQEELDTQSFINKRVEETDQFINNITLDIDDDPFTEDDELRESKHKLIEYLRSKHSFEGFHHYTDFTNFLSIMRNGRLYSRNHIYANNFCDAADQEVLDNTPEVVKDFVRFYYKEKTPTFYRNEGIKKDNGVPHMPIPVILLFQESIIYSPGVSFLSGCGGSKYSTLTDNPEDALKFDWGTIFRRGPIDSYLDYNSFEESARKRARIINRRNAEFLFPEEIDVNLLKKIIFRAPADLKRARTELGDSDLFELDFRRIKFNFNHNFLFDYKIEKLEDKFSFALLFNSDFTEYSHDLRIKYEDKIENINISSIENLVAIDIIESNERKLSFNYTPANIESVTRIDYCELCI